MWLADVAGLFARMSDLAAGGGNRHVSVVVLWLASGLRRCNVMLGDGGGLLFSLAGGFSGVDDGGGTQEQGREGRRVEWGVVCMTDGLGSAKFRWES